MAKKLLFLLTFVLILSIVSSASIENKDSFQLGEVAIFKVNAVFSQSLSDNSIKFFRNNVEAPFEFETKKLGDNYFIFAQTAQKTSSNYSVSINQSHFVSGEFVTQEIVSEFEILSQSVDFTLSPTFSTTKNFGLEFQSLSDASLTIEYSLENSYEINETSFEAENSFSLSPLEKKTIDFNSGALSGLSTLYLKSSNSFYMIPLYTSVASLCGNSVIDSGESCDTDNLGDISSCEDLGYDFGELNCYPSSSNKGCDFDVSDCSYEDIQNESNSNTTSENETQEAVPECEADSDCLSDNQKCTQGICVTEAVEKLCSDFNGSICAYDEVCSGETQEIGGNICCKATCEAKKSSSGGKIVGWALLIIALAVIFWIFKKYKSAN